MPICVLCYCQNSSLSLFVKLIDCQNRISHLVVGTHVRSLLHIPNTSFLVIIDAVPSSLPIRNLFSSCFVFGKKNIPSDAACSSIHVPIMLPRRRRRHNTDTDKTLNASNLSSKFGVGGDGRPCIIQTALPSGIRLVHQFR